MFTSGNPEDIALAREVDAWLYEGRLTDRLPVPWDNEVKTIGCSVFHGVVYHPSLKPFDVQRLGLKITIGER